MTHRRPEGYAGGRLAAWFAGLRDRLRGEHARANARAGYLRAPQGRGKVVWIKTGGTPESVRLGVELMGALREKRVDIRIVLTFENDVAEIIEPRVRGMRHIGLGYGPSDVPAVVRRVLSRFEPLGVILVDTPLHPNLLRQAGAQGMHLIAFNTEPPQAGTVKVEAAYPRNEAEQAAWEASGAADFVSPPADVGSLFSEAQADPSLKSLMGGGRDYHYWWWHGEARALDEVLRAWREGELNQAGVLFVSLEDAAPIEGADVMISQWRRRALEAGQVVGLDEARWWAVVASSVTAIHLQAARSDVLWAALSGGAALSASQHVVDGFSKLSGTVEALPDIESVLTRWHAFAQQPLDARRRGDACRRLFWEERRRVQAVSDEFTQRVFDW